MRPKNRDFENYHRCSIIIRIGHSCKYTRGFLKYSALLTKLLLHLIMPNDMFCPNAISGDLQSAAEK